jgi:hypothetical protein
MKFWRRFFYTLAGLQFAMSEYVRWIEGNRPEAGYWLAHAILSFLIAYLCFTERHDAAGERS